jgi:hypothetical protein
MIIKKGLTKILAVVRKVVDSLSNKYVKEDKKDYKYKNEVIKDDWEEILKGNDYY